MTFPETLPILDGQQPEQPQGPQDYGPNNEQLPEQLVNLLSSTVRKFQTEEMYLRRREILRDWRHRLYERGYQHLRETGGKDGGWAMISAGGVYSGTGGDVQAPVRVDDYNIFQPFTRALIAVHSQNPPGVDFRPNDNDSAQDLEASEAAEKFRHHYDRTNDVKALQEKIVRTMALSGRTVTWTRTEADADQFGENEQGEPKSEEITTVFGAIESKISLFVNGLSAANYVFLMDDIDIRTAKNKYKDFASKIKPTTGVLGQNAYERIARLGVLMNSRGYTQVGEALNHLVPRLNGFIRTRAFTGDEFDNACDDDPSMTLGEKLRELFPHGCQLTFMGDVYVGSRDACVDDEVKIAFPFPGDGMGRMAMMEPMVVFEDRFNDGMNAAAEVFERWPSLWIDCEDDELDAINDQQANPGSFRGKKLRTGQKMADVLFQERNPEVTQSFLAWMEKLSGELPQFILAIQPALFGAEMSDQKTASGYAQARAQAMGMQGPTWAAIQELFAGIYEQAALLASKNPDHGEEIRVPGEDGGVVQMAALRKGHFGCYPDQDSSFPETTAAKRQTLSGLVSMAAQSPMGAALFEEPENWDLIATLMGFPGLRFPQVDARRAARVKIDKLLQGAPVPPPPEALQAAVKAHADQTLAAHAGGGEMPPPFDPQAGLMELTEPSVPIEPWIYAPFEAQEFQAWLNSEACRTVQSNPEPDAQKGLANVILYWQKVQQMAAKQMVAQMALQAPKPPQAGPKPGEKPPMNENEPKPQAAPAPTLG